MAFPEFDVVAGVATAGIPHGALLADLIGKPFIYVRSKNKGHGRKNLIEGELSPESKVLVIEDLISTGMSSMAACDALINEGSEIVGVLAIFTYGFSSAADLFTERKIPLETLTNYRVLLQEALETNYINSEEKKTLETWNKNPKEWKGIQAT